MKNYPNFQSLFDEVYQYVKENQGEKGYIDCQPSLSNDIIYAIIYDDFSGVGIEKYVYGVRTNGDDLEVILEDVMRTYLTEYKDSDFKDSEKWQSIRWGDVYYAPTLLNIAEYIEEYGE